VIEHFLKDISDGKYDGFPMAGARIVALQNPAYRQYLKMPNANAGARVDGFAPESAAEKVLKTEDVVLKVGPLTILNII
jgi:hypothetical protein